jgi:hypothetical protein
LKRVVDKIKLSFQSGEVGRQLSLRGVMAFIVGFFGLYLFAMRMAQ